MWVDTADLPTNDGHPYFERLNRVLADSGFDAFVEELCAAFYADRTRADLARPVSHCRNRVRTGRVPAAQRRARADLSGGTGVTRLPARPDPRGLSVGACHANPVTGDIRLIEVKGLAAATGTVLLTPNERRVAEDRPDCYWLYVVTDCGQKPVLQEPIADPARFPWREVTKVQHYYLSVDAMTGPMPVGGSGTD